LFTMAEVEVSAQFFGWLCGLGGLVKITEPRETAESYQRWLEEIMQKYISE